MSNVCAVRFFGHLYRDSLRMTGLEAYCAPHKPPLCKGRCLAKQGGGVVNLVYDNPPVRCADSPLCTRGPRAGPCKLPQPPLAFPFRPRGLHITRPRLSARPRSFRRSSSALHPFRQPNQRFGASLIPTKPASLGFRGDPGRCRTPVRRMRCRLPGKLSFNVSS